MESEKDPLGEMSHYLGRGAVFGLIPLTGEYVTQELRPKTQTRWQIILFFLSGIIRSAGTTFTSCKAAIVKETKQRELFIQIFSSFFLYSCSSSSCVIFFLLKKMRDIVTCCCGLFIYFAIVEEGLTTMMSYDDELPSRESFSEFPDASKCVINLNIYYHFLLFFSSSF